MPPINLLIKPASGNCNMQCDYCFYCDEIGKREQASYGMMSQETLRMVIKRTLLRAEGSYNIAFQGGEPTLCGLDYFRKVIEYVNKFNRNGVHVEYALQTNGFVIDEEWAKFFAENHFLIGVSVDGLPQIHDRYRHQRSTGADTYERIEKATRILDRYKVDYNILTVVHRETARHIREIYRAYRKRGWNYMQFITCLDPIGEKRGQKEYSLLPKDYGQFLTDLFDEWYKDFEHGDQPFIRQFNNYLMMLLGYPPESCEQRGICGMQLVVEADGGVYPCDFYVLDSYRLGNFNENLLPEIDARCAEIGFISRSRNHPEACRECRWFPLCRGGCFRSRLTKDDEEAGLGTEGLNYFCEGYKMFFSSCIDRLESAAGRLAGSPSGH